MKDVKGLLPWLGLALLIIGLDQASKLYMLATLDLHQPVVVVPGFNLMLTYNTGAAFSFLSEAGGWQRWFFVVLAVVVSLVLVTWLYRLPQQARWLASALALILGGAVGNLWDRLYYGYVIDFIQIYYDQWYFPAFNLADSAITVGAVMLIIDAIWLSQESEA